MRKFYPSLLFILNFNPFRPNFSLLLILWMAKLLPNQKYFLPELLILKSVLSFFFHWSFYFFNEIKLAIVNIYSLISNNHSRHFIFWLSSDLFYLLNNFQCHAVTWYLSCDYQLTILGTVLFYFYQKDKKLGFTAFGTAVVFSFIIPGVITYWYQLPAIHFMDLG